MTDEEARAVLARYDQAVRVFDDAVDQHDDADAVYDAYREAMSGLVHELAEALRPRLA